MANQHRGKVEIELDKTRNLRFTMNALAEIEDKLGVPLAKMKDVEMNIKNVRAILWAGLIHEDEEITETQVGNMIDLDNFEYVQEKLEKAFGGTTKNSK